MVSVPASIAASVSVSPKTEVPVNAVVVVGVPQVTTVEP